MPNTSFVFSGMSTFTCNVSGNGLSMSEISSSRFKSAQDFSLGIIFTFSTWSNSLILSATIFASALDFKYTEISRTLPNSCAKDET